MKTGLTFFLTCISTLLWAQQAFIEPDNPSPRVGDQIHLSIQLSDTKSPNPASDDPESRIATGTFKLTRTLADTGMVNVGPFSFTLNNHTYEAPTVTLRVRPALPESQIRGVWASIVEYQGYVFVIVEQRIPGSIKRDPTDPNTLVMSVDEPDFAELNSERLMKYGLEFISSSVSMDTQDMERKGSAVSVSYRLASYKFRPVGSSIQHVRIDKSFFANFPKGVSFEEPTLH